MLSEWYHRLLEKLHIDGRDLAVFLLSLLSAFSIWVIHTLSLEYSTVLDVPVIAVSNIDGHAAESSTSSSIVARCRTTGVNTLRTNFYAGRKARKVYFKPEDFRHVEGETFSLSASVLAGYVGDIFGDDIQLESVISTDVQFRFPFENSRKVPVQFRSIFGYKSQYMATGAVRVEPDSVVVYGEPIRLDNITSILTETISADELSSSIHGVARLQPPAGVRLSQDEVNFSQEVTRFVELSDEVSVTVRGVPAGKHLAVFPSTVKVTYRCAFPLSSDPTGNVDFYIDYESFEASGSGDCLLEHDKLPVGVIDFFTEPQVFRCMEVTSR